MGSENGTSMVGMYRDFENIHASLEDFGEGDVLVVIGKSEDIARLDDAGPA